MADHNINVATPQENYVDKLLVGKQDTCLKRWTDKGTVSNFITFTIMVVGWFLAEAQTSNSGSGDGTDSKGIEAYILAFGLFGFAGGITNWLAVKMLFDKVGCAGYYLYGSGVIPRRFKEIRETVKN